MRRLIALIFAAVFASGTSVFTFKATAQDHAPSTGRTVVSVVNANALAPFPFEPTEELNYEVTYTKLLLRNINVAEISFASKRDSQASDASRAASKAVDANFHFTMEMASKGIVPRLFGFRFHQRVESTIDPASFAVIQTTRLDEQNERQRTSEAVFDKQAGKVVWTERNPKQPQRATRVVASNFDGTLQDIVSIFYFLRTQQLTTNLKFEIPLSDSGRIFSVPIAVAETKKLKTVLGEAMTVRIDVDVFGEGRLLPGDGNLSIWFTNDARRIPVQAHITSSMGTIDVKLKSRTPSLKTTR